MTFIYALADPRQPFMVRYVGKADKPTLRLRQHIHQLRQGVCNPEFQEWLRDILDAGLLPALAILEEVKPPDQWQQRESYWIGKYTTGPLLNKRSEVSTQNGY